MVTVFTLEVAVIQKRAIKKTCKTTVSSFLVYLFFDWTFWIAIFFPARVHSLFEILSFILFLFFKAILYLAGTT